jgi:small-conductance mechanosensitive channel
MPVEHPVISQTRGSCEVVSIYGIVTSKDEKRTQRVMLKCDGEERQIRAAEMQYSVMHRMLNALLVLATVGAALMVFDQVRAFGASPLTSAGIVGLAAGVAAQRTLQKRLCRSAACSGEYF